MRSIASNKLEKKAGCPFKDSHTFTRRNNTVDNNIKESKGHGSLYKANTIICTFKCKEVNAPHNRYRTVSKNPTTMASQTCQAIYKLEVISFVLFYVKIEQILSLLYHFYRQQKYKTETTFSLMK